MDIGIYRFEPEGVNQRISNLLIYLDLRSPASLLNPRICHQICHHEGRGS